jgi:hypothetical protein
MRIVIPSDLITTAERAAYRRGWKDRGTKQASRGGKVTSEAKTLAARANATKPPAPGKRRGRPRKNPVKEPAL